MASASSWMRAVEVAPQVGIDRTDRASGRRGSRIAGSSQNLGFNSPRPTLAFTVVVQIAVNVGSVQLIWELLNQGQFGPLKSFSPNWRPGDFIPLPVSPNETQLLGILSVLTVAAMMHAS